MRVVLTPREVAVATAIGAERHYEALRRGLPDKYGCEGDGWGFHIEGAAGELAAAKALDRYWSPSVNTFRNGGDVGRLQVRTRSSEGYDLIVREADSNSDVFVLVLGKLPSFDVVGWIRGAEAKQGKWLAGHGGRPPAYFVPKAALRPLSELERMSA